MLNYFNKKLPSSVSLIFIILLVAVVGIYSYWQYSETQKEQTNQIIAVKIPEKNQTTITNETVDWKTYTNQEYGFEIKYPKEAQISPHETNWFNRNVTIIEIPTDNNSNKTVNILPFKFSSIYGCSLEGLETEEGLSKNIIATDTIKINNIGFYKEIERDEGEDYIFEAVNYSTVKGNLCIVLHLQPFDKEKDTDVLNQMLSTFKFLQ